MQFDINEDGIETTYLNDDDICWICENQYGCPLIECLNRGLVIPTEDIQVRDCALFRK